MPRFFSTLAKRALTLVLVGALLPAPGLTSTQTQTVLTNPANLPAVFGLQALVQPLPYERQSNAPPKAIEESRHISVAATPTSELAKLENILRGNSSPQALQTAWETFGTPALREKLIAELKMAGTELPVVQGNLRAFRIRLQGRERLAVLSNRWLVGDDKEKDWASVLIAPEQLEKLLGKTELSERDAAYRVKDLISGKNYPRLQYINQAHNVGVPGPGFQVLEFTPVPKPELWWRDHRRLNVAVDFSVSALRRAVNDPGIGKFSDLPEFFEKELAPYGINTLKLLPFFAFLNDSPYAPVSLEALNELYIDWSLVPEVRGSERLLSALKAEGDLRKVDYDAVRRWERPVAEQAWENFKAMGTRMRRWKDFQKFLTDNAAWINDYAEFMALHEILNSECLKWPAGEVLEQVKRENAEQYQRSYDKHRFAQWIAYGQMEEAFGKIVDQGGHIVIDMPMFRGKDSVDVWKYPQYFRQPENPEIYPGINRWEKVIDGKFHFKPGFEFDEALAVDDVYEGWYHLKALWRDLALWNWPETEKDSFEPQRRPYRHWMKFLHQGEPLIQGMRADALHFAYYFDRGQLYDSDAPGDRYVSTLAELFKESGIMPIAEAYETVADPIARFGFLRLGSDIRRLSDPDTPAQTFHSLESFVGKLAKTLPQNLSELDHAFMVAFNLVDLSGDPFSMKERNGDGSRSFWHYRISLPSDPDYGNRHPWDARAAIAEKIFGYEKHVLRPVYQPGQSGSSGSGLVTAIALFTISAALWGGGALKAPAQTIHPKIPIQIQREFLNFRRDAPPPAPDAMIRQAIRQLDSETMAEEAAFHLSSTMDLPEPLAAEILPHLLSAFERMQKAETTEENAGERRGFGRLLMRLSDKKSVQSLADGILAGHDARAKRLLIQLLGETSLFKRAIQSIIHEDPANTQAAIQALQDPDTQFAAITILKYAGTPEAREALQQRLKFVEAVDADEGEASDLQGELRTAVDELRDHTVGVSNAIQTLKSAMDEPRPDTGAASRALIFLQRQLANPVARDALHQSADFRDGLIKTLHNEYLEETAVMFLSQGYSYDDDLGVPQGEIRSKIQAMAQKNPGSHAEDLNIAMMMHNWRVWGFRAGAVFFLLNPMRILYVLDRFLRRIVSSVWVRVSMAIYFMVVPLMFRDRGPISIPVVRVVPERSLLLSA